MNFPDDYYMPISIFISKSKISYFILNYGYELYFHILHIIRLLKI